ncbi:hypothetical protein MBAV_004720 [Candidatus Magnetobacterium bavaricum]|uniref:Uncharacterized protein n=1 Tax=Candidatus Magnetobacterium bavaricum TaxID=29290 RepID=A0A0F3GMG1_9BACT|nr:hypothetical protein MBAV_004720 [Candidatus Magnetobacterium bavaricum]
MNRYEEFWIVWNDFYPKIVEMCKDEMSSYYNRDTVHSYLLATGWKEDARQWHTLKDREISFFTKVVKDIGNHPALLYSIAKLLNGIGSRFGDAGVGWISSILQNDKTLSTNELEKNTIFYIEKFVRGYILKNPEKIKKDKQVKKQTIVILDFLVEQGSEIGYSLREGIL